MNTKPANYPPAETVVKRLGGVMAAAALCEVTHQAVYLWLKNGVIPRLRLVHIRAVRPDVLKPVRKKG